MLGDPPEQEDWQHDIREDITLLIVKTVTHRHYAEASRQYPEVERALARARAFLEGAASSGYRQEEAEAALDEVALALGLVQTKFGWQ